jgi:hypothetical protein
LTWRVNPICGCDHPTGGSPQTFDPYNMPPADLKFTAPIGHRLVHDSHPSSH